MRYISTNATAAAQNNGGSNAPVALYGDAVAGEAIPANSAIAIGGDNKAYLVADPAAPGATLRPANQPTDLYLGLQSMPTLYASGIQGRVATARLTTGNIVRAWVSAASPYNVQFLIYDPHGVTLSPAIVTAGQSVAGGGTGAPQLALTATLNGFALAWASNGGPALAIYDNNANTIKAATAIAPGTALFALAIAPLTNNNLAVVWSGVNGTESASYAILSSTGNTVKAATVIKAAPASNPVPCAVSLAALTGGGFIVAYAINQGGGAPNITNYFQRFDNTGTSLAPETILRAGAAVASGVVTKALPSGGFIVAETADVRLSAYTAAGAAIGAASSKSPGQIRNRLAIAASASLGFAAAIWSDNPATTIKAAPINDSTGPQAGTITLTTSAAADSDLQLLINAPQTWAGPWIIAATWADAANKLTAATYNGSFVTLATATYTGITSDTNAASAPTGSAIWTPSPIAPSAPVFTIDCTTSAGTASFAIINTYIQRQTAAGVSTAAVAQGQTCTYQWGGQATLSAPWSARQSIPIYPASQTMHVLGTKVTFTGVKA